MIEITINGVRVQHRGHAPFTARSASNRTDDWPSWIVVGSDGSNRLSFPDKPGAVLTSKESALTIADELNKATQGAPEHA